MRRGRDSGGDTLTRVQVALRTSNYGKLSEGLSTGANPNSPTYLVNVGYYLRGSESERQEIRRRLGPFIGKGDIIPSVGLLHEAILLNDIQATNLLLNFGANINQFCGYSHKTLTPAHLAVVMDHNDLLKLLVNRKAKINFYNKDRQTPLDLAICVNNVSAVAVLAPFKQFYYFRNSLMSKLTIADYLSRCLTDGAKFEVIDLMIGVGYEIGIGFPDNVLLYILENMNVEDPRAEPLIERLVEYSKRRSNHLNIVNGKNLNGQDSCLHFSVRRKSLKLTKLFIRLGVDVDAVNCRQKTALNCLVEEEGEVTSRWKEMAVLLLERGANLFHEDDEGNYPLLMVITGKKVDAFDVFRKYLAKAKAAGRTRHSFTDYCRKEANPDPQVVQTFLDFGIKANYENSVRETPLLCLLKYSKRGDNLSECIDLLLSSNASLSKTDNQHNTPLIVAIKSQLPLIVVSKLIPNNDSINMVNVDGDDALDLALIDYKTEKEEDKESLVSLLLRNENLDLKSQRLGTKSLLFLAKQSAFSDATVTLLLASGYRPSEMDMQSVFGWNLTVVDIVLDHVGESYLIKRTCPRALLQLLANFFKNPTEHGSGHLLRLIKRLVEDFDLDVNHCEVDSVLHLLIGHANRYDVTPIIDYLLSLEEIDLDISVEGHGTPLAYSLVLGEYKIAEQLISKSGYALNCHLTHIRLKPGFSCPLLLLLDNGFDGWDILFSKANESSISEDVVRELNWFKNLIALQKEGSLSIYCQRSDRKPNINNLNVRSKSSRIFVKVD